MAKKNGLLATALGASASAQAQSKGARLLKSSIRTSRDYVESVEKELDVLIGKKEEIMEVSAGIDLNAGMKGITSEEMDAKVIAYHKIHFEILLKQAELKAAKIAHEELVGSEEEEG